MNSTKSLVALGVMLALGAGQQVWAQDKEEDSVYQWGRWAVLSPAAGGEPYVPPVIADAANNARPGDASQFQPELAGVSTPPPGPAEPPIAVPGPVDPPGGDPRGLPPIAVPGPSVPPGGDPRGSLPAPPSGNPRGG